MRLDRLHQVIQAAMGWENYHLHVFSDGRTRYGVPDPKLGSGTSAGQPCET
jgi:hypothetical protein